MDRFLPKSVDPGSVHSNSADYIELFGDINHLVESVSGICGYDDDQVAKRVDVLEGMEASGAPLAARPGSLGASAFLMGCLEIALADDRMVSSDQLSLF